MSSGIQLRDKLGLYNGKLGAYELLGNGKAVVVMMAARGKIMLFITRSFDLLGAGQQ